MRYLLFSLMIIMLLSAACTPRAKQSLVVQGTEATRANNYLLHAMLLRGASDYGAIRGAIPKDIQELEEDGFLSYRLPNSSSLSYRSDGATGVVSSNGKQLYDGIQEISPIESQVKVLPTFKEEKGTYPEVVTLPDGTTKVEYRESSPRIYLFYGAEWLENGTDRTVVEDAMRYERLRRHYVFATNDFQAKLGRMPESLKELDDFIRLDKNDIAWRNVSFVSSPSLVGAKAGNFFVGWESDSFLICSNNGPKIETSRFVKSGSGNYVNKQTITY
jgi:hypothetical protein